MDNNFDENRSVSNNTFSEESFSEPPFPQQPEPVIPQEQNAFSEENPGIQPAQGIPANAGSESVQQPMQGFPNAQGFTNMQGVPNGGFSPYYPYPQYAPEQGGFPEAPKKRRFSGAWFWAMIALIVVFLAVIIVLAAMISSQVKSMNDIKDKEKNFFPEAGFSASIEKESEEGQVVIKLQTSQKPVLEEELYRNKDTGLLTTVGVAKMVLPSQVKVDVFGEVPYTPLGSGSGVIISPDGYIVTNAHVVDGVNGISATFYDGSSSEAVVVGIDTKSDLAVIKVDRNDLTAAEIGTSADLVIGEEVAVAGAGGGYENTVTYGYVTGLDRKVSNDYMSSSVVHCIQTDAALNLGNSGGALVNMYGQVVGITSAHMPSSNYENIGFSIAIDDAVPIIEELIAYGYVSSRAMVGINYLSVGDSMASSYEIMPGLCVMEILPESRAAAAGIMPYDIVTQIDDVRVFGAGEVLEALSGKTPGDTVRLTVFRRSVTGENSIFETSLELIPEPSPPLGYYAPISSEEFYGREVVK